MNEPTTRECYPHHHMTASEYGFYDVCRSLSFHTNILYFNGPAIAARFRSMSKNTPYTLAESLVSSGWLVLLKDSTRRRNGTFTPRQYRVLSHDEWVQGHPDQCKAPTQDQGLDESTPFPNTDCPFPNTEQPSQKEGNNLIKYTYVNQPREPLIESPPQNEGMDIARFVGRFSKAGRREHKKALRQGVSADAPIGDGAPFPENGMGNVRNTHMFDVPTQALRLSTPLMGTLGITDPTVRQKWNVSIQNLLMQGYNPDFIKRATEASAKEARAVMLTPDDLSSNHGAAGFERYIRNNFSTNGKVIMQ